MVFAIFMVSHPDYQYYVTLTNAPLAHLAKEQVKICAYGQNVCEFENYMS